MYVYVHVCVCMYLYTHTHTILSCAFSLSLFWGGEKGGGRINSSSDIINYHHLLYSLLLWSCQNVHPEQACAVTACSKCAG